jgi:predicted house-cleaning NTP pyrophosphatase (Maf/HAM1 superfamily)
MRKTYNINQDYKIIISDTGAVIVHKGEIVGRFNNNDEAERFILKLSLQPKVN